MAGSLSVNDAWHSVSLEERLELIARSQAYGIAAAMLSMLLMGTIAYGFDQIWLLAGGAALSVLVIPFFSDYSWRQDKPKLILNYLAVRSVARRYAYGYEIPDINIVLIFRGKMKHLFANKEEEELFKQSQEVDFYTNNSREKDVWICLLQSGIVILSERPGGARLEYVTAITPNVRVRKPTSTEEAKPESVVIEGIGSALGRTVAINSKYPGALYVFEKQLDRLIPYSERNQKKLASIWK